MFTGTYAILIKLSLVLALCGGIYGTYKFRVHQAVQEAVHIVELKHNADLLSQKESLLNQARDKEQKLQASFDVKKKENDAKIKVLNSTVSTMLSSLSNRPIRPSSDSGANQDTTTTASPAGATGAQLFAGDGAFLVRFSATTETLKLSLIQCYNDYDSVKQAIESFSAK